jgi:hypothetical protein
MSIGTKKASSGPTFRFSDDPDTGVGSSAANTLDLYAGGTSYATVTSSGLSVTGFTATGEVLPIEITTGADSLTAAESGKVMMIDSTTTRIISLPATAAGLTYTITVKTAATSGNGHQISPVAADKIIDTAITPADDKDLINTQATGKAGDSVTLVGDGVDGWLVVAKTGTWAREA